jgi:hypothetical protein
MAKKTTTGKKKKLSSRERERGRSRATQARKKIDSLKKFEEE